MINCSCSQSTRHPAQGMLRTKGLLNLILICLLFSAPECFGQSTDKNHIVSYTARKSGLTSLSGKPKTEVAVSVSYMDRLGRQIQSIAKEASPNGKDAISFNEYDSYGLQSKNYLPYASGTSTSANYISTAKSDQASFYNTSSDQIADDTAPWNFTDVEKSPAKRILSQNGVGSYWQDKPTRYEYTFNTTSDNVLEWEITNDGLLKLTSTHFYAANTLSVTIAKGPEWSSGSNDHSAQTFKDHLGRTILQRSFNGTETYDTYYIYDEFGNLRYLVPPAATDIILNAGTAGIDDSKIFLTSQNFPSGFAKNTTYYYMPGVAVTLPAGMTFSNGFKLLRYPVTADMVEDLLFVNEYDDNNRLVSKKTPGAEPIYYVYDPNGRLILSQDGNQRNNDEWTFTKYDQFDRPALTGTGSCTTLIGSANASRTTAQSHVTSAFNAIDPKYWYEQVAATVPGYASTVIHEYTNSCYPQNVTDENDYLLVTYYDGYEFKSSWGSNFDFDNANGINDGPHLPIVRGVETGGKIKVLGESTWLRSVKYYDFDIRFVQGVSEPYTGDTEKVYLKTNFTGDLLESKFIHSTGSGKDITVYERFEYDHAGRLIKQYHSMDDEPEVILAEYEYNEAGELIDKDLHSTDNGGSFIQSVDYRYQLDGKLSHLNNADRDNDSGVTNDDTNDLFGMQFGYTYNKLGSVAWSHPHMSGSDQRAYDYTYDKVNRLIGADYNELQGSTWGTNENHYNVSGIGYDYNGNIKTLQRKQGINGNATTVDDLNYTYDGNQLQSINDQTSYDEGFKDGAESAVEYTYDGNGNMVSDANKLISGITYNLLNKPERVIFSSGDYIDYTYDAAGAKLKQEVWINSALADKTEYSSGFIFEDGELALVSMPQGRIIVEKVAADYNYDYQYFLTDHLGNNRVMFAPQARAYAAGMETEDAIEEEAQFLNITSTRNQDAVYSRNGDEAARLNAYDGKIIGPAKGMKLYAGDSVYMETWVKYDDPNSTNLATSATTIHSFLATAVGVSSGGAGELGDIYDGLGDALGSAGLISQGQNDTPAAYLNYIFLDANYENPVGGFVQADVMGEANDPFDSLALSFNATEEGYLFVYLSNESKLDVDVYFDDFQIVHVSDASVLQADDYYPFGLPITGNNYTQTGTKENRFLYQGKEWQTDLAQNLNLNLYDFHARQYDPATGRFTSSDPAGQFASPYNGMGNAPTMSVDPDGEVVWAPIIGMAVFNAIRAGDQAWRNDGNIWGSIGQSLALSAASSALSFGVGEVFGHGPAGSFLNETGRAGAHGLVGGTISSLRGGGFGSGFMTSAFSSGMGSGLDGLGISGGDWDTGITSLTGGLTSLYSGGDFFEGYAQGMYISLLNRYGGDEKKKLEDQQERVEIARRVMLNKGQTEGWSPNWKAGRDALLQLFNPFNNEPIRSGVISAHIDPWIVPGGGTVAVLNRGEAALSIFHKLSNGALRARQGVTNIVTASGKTISSTRIISASELKGVEWFSATMRGTAGNTSTKTWIIYESNSALSTAERVKLAALKALEGVAHWFGL